MRVRLGVYVVSALRIGDHSSELLLALVRGENENAEDHNCKQADPGLFLAKDHARI